MPRSFAAFVFCQFVWLNTQKMYAFSIDSKVGFPVSGAGEISAGSEERSFSGKSADLITLPFESRNARVIVFSSSRTLPGQSAAMRSHSASSSRVLGAQLCLKASFARK